MKPIAFSREETADAVAALQRYFQRELDVELGKLPAEMLLDFLKETLGPRFYNKGLADAQAMVAAKADDLVEAIYTLEQPISRGR